jgi:hypothetical protein
VLLERAKGTIDNLLPDLEYLAGIQAGQVIESGGAKAGKALKASSDSLQASATRIQSYVMSFTEGDDDYKETYAEIFFEVVRSIGHKAIYCKEQPYIGWMTAEAMKLLAYVEDTVIGLIEGVCGFIPEVGGIISWVVVSAVDLLFTQVEVVLETGLQNSLETFWNEQINSLRNDFLDALGTVPPGANTTLLELDEFLASLPHEKLLRLWTGIDLQDDREQIDKLLTTVNDLASATASQ